MSTFLDCSKVQQVILTHDDRVKNLDINLSAQFLPLSEQNSTYGYVTFMS